MKPVDAIEFALRLNEKPMKAGEILGLVKDIVNEDGVDEHHLSATAKAAPQRFIVLGDTITLQPARAENRVEFFRQRLLGIRDALKLTPFFGSNAFGLELALIYALATRMPEQFPSILKGKDGLWPILDQLSEEFPVLKYDLSQGLKDSWMVVRARVQSELLLMASARLTPMEHMREMRGVIERDARSGQFCTPWSVAELMARLLGDEVKMVFDPAADASLLPAVLALNGKAKAEGVFVNRFGQFFSTLQARILGAELTTTLNERPAPKDAKLYTHCISAPPFGGRVKEEGSLRAIESYEIAINQIIKRLAPGGRAVVLVPESMLFSTNKVGLRKQLIDLGLLKAVISLPVGTFSPHAGIKTSVLVLERSELPSNNVRFIDAALHIASRSPKELTLDMAGILTAWSGTYSNAGVLEVTLAEIRSDEQLSLTMSRFASLLQQAQIVAESAGVDVVELGSLLADDILSMGDHAGLPLFQVTELSSDVLDMRRTAHNGQQETGSTKKGPKRLDVPALLLARVGGKLKPTLFDPVDGPIAVGNNVFMFRVDTRRADAEYIAIELRSPMVQDQLDAYHQGSTIASIAKADLLRVRVRLPDLAEQRRIVRERKEAILLAKKEEIARQEKQHGLSSIEWQILGSVEHSFRPVLALVEEPMEAIRLLAADLDAQKQARVSTELGRIDAGLDRMRGLFKLINDVIRSDKDSLRPVPVDLRRLFRTEVRGLGEQIKDLRVYFQCEAGLESADGVVARVDQEQFALVIQNLLTNMAKHARDPKRDDLTVLVHVGTRTEPGRTWLVIMIENNGKPFAEGFSHQDLVTFGKRLDSTNGNGIGGYLMDRIIANHHGRFSSGNLELDERTARSSFAKDQRLDENHWEPLDWETGSTHMTVRFTIELPIDHPEDHD